jgi:hypothetical protein
MLGMSSEALVGTLFAGRLRVDSLIGEGRRGPVYLVQHEMLQRSFALRLLTHRTYSREEFARFRCAARAAAHVEHRNLALIFDFGHTDAGRGYLLVEHVLATPLPALIATEPLRPARVVEILSQIAEALAAIHARGLAHGDLQGGSVLVARRGRGDEIKVLDLGLAAIADLAAWGERGGDLRAWASIARALVAASSTAPSAELELLIRRCEGAEPPPTSSLVAGLRSQQVVSPEPSVDAPRRPPRPSDSWRELSTEVDPRLSRENVACADRARALVDLAYAVRDRALGSAAIVLQLSRLAQAEARLEEASEALRAMEQEVVDAERIGLLREARSSRLLSQLELEKIAALGTAEDAMQHSPPPGEHGYERLWAAADRLGTAAVEVNQWLQRDVRLRRMHAAELQQRIAQRQRELVSLHLEVEQLRTRMLELVRQVRLEATAPVDAELEQLFLAAGL